MERTPRELGLSSRYSITVYRSPSRGSEQASSGLPAGFQALVHTAAQSKGRSKGGARAEQGALLFATTAMGLVWGASEGRSTNNAVLALGMPSCMKA